MCIIIQKGIILIQKVVIIRQNIGKSISSGGFQYMKPANSIVFYTFVADYTTFFALKCKIMHFFVTLLSLPRDFLSEKFPPWEARLLES